MIVVRLWFLFFSALVALGIRAQPGTLPIAISYSCLLPPPDSVDLTGDGIADLVVQGRQGISTSDKPPSHVECLLVVQTLPGTLLLASLHPMGGRVVHGFAPGDTIPAWPLDVQDDLRIPRYAFVEGAVRALHWSGGRNRDARPQAAPGADRTYVFATTAGDRIVHGTFTLKVYTEERTVRVRPRIMRTANEPWIVR